MVLPISPKGREVRSALLSHFCAIETMVPVASF